MTPGGVERDLEPDAEEEGNTATNDSTAASSPTGPFLTFKWMIDDGLQGACGS